MSERTPTCPLNPNQLNNTCSSEEEATDAEIIDKIHEICQDPEQLQACGLQVPQTPEEDDTNKALLALHFRLGGSDLLGALNASFERGDIEFRVGSNRTT